MTGPERNYDQINRAPLTVVLLMVFSLALGFSLIYIFAFSDTSKDRWEHFYQALPVVAVAGTLFAFAQRREARGPLPLGARRAIWWSLVVGYLIAASGVMVIGISPYAGLGDKLRLVCYLGAAAPLAYLPWHFLRSERKRANQSLQPTPVNRRG